MLPDWTGLSYGYVATREPPSRATERVKSFSRIKSIIALVSGCIPTARWEALPGGGEDGWPLYRLLQQLSPHTQAKLTKEVRVQVLAVGVGHPLEGRALLLHSHFQPVWVDGGNDYNPSLIDQLQKVNEAVQDRLNGTKTNKLKLSEVPGLNWIIHV